jgi:hypothetical protein
MEIPQMRKQHQQQFSGEDPAPEVSGDFTAARLAPQPWSIAGHRWRFRIRILGRHSPFK